MINTNSAESLIRPGQDEFIRQQRSDVFVVASILDRKSRLGSQPALHVTREILIEEIMKAFPKRKPDLQTIVRIINAECRTRSGKDLPLSIVGEKVIFHKEIIQNFYLRLQLGHDVAAAAKEERTKY